MYKAKKIGIYTAAFVLLVVVLSWIQPAKDRATSYVQLGSISKVDNCIAGKRKLSCDVVTDTHTLKTNVVDWPGDNLQIGDVIGNRIDVAGGRKDVWVCKNGECREQSVCWKWMPCWDKT